VISSGRSNGAVGATVFAILLPALVSSFLSAVWLMRALHDARLR